jgi:hypothetical protein
MPAGRAVYTRLPRRTREDGRLSAGPIASQVVDADEDQTRALGVVTFRLGRQLGFVPVFFGSGEVKGHELLYLQGQDGFVPSDENWVNYLLNKRPDQVGKPVTRSVSLMGVWSPSICPPPTCRPAGSHRPPGRPA